jgi:hypothetical protein
MDFLTPNIFVFKIYANYFFTYIRKSSDVIFYFFFFVTLFFPAIVSAEELQPRDENIVIGLHLGSLHSATGFNDFNPGAYIEFENHITLGHYYNSNYRESSYAGYTYPYDSNIELTLGLITGYPLFKYTPLIVPSYKFPKLIQSATLRLAFIPRFFGVVQANVLHVMVESSF